MHALYLALAFAKIGYIVDFYTNAKPVFYEEAVKLFGDNNFNLIINKWFLWRKKEKYYEHIVFPPHIGRRRFAEEADRYLIYPFIKRLKRMGGKLWLLDFESPLWKSEVDDTVLNGYRHVIELTKEIDVILSTTETGRVYAREFYGKIKPDLMFEQLYLCINSYLAEKYGISRERKDCAVVFYRTGEAHKNNEAIVNMIKSLPTGFTLLLIGRFGEADDRFLQTIYEEGKTSGITIKKESNVSDERKFEILSSSRLLFFSSRFEGYGLPPIEAQYVGTPVVCSKLPVLKEVNKYAVFADFSDVRDLQNAVKEALVLNHKTLYCHVRSFASVQSFCNQLQNIAGEIDRV